MQATQEHTSKSDYLIVALISLVADNLAKNIQHIRPVSPEHQAFHLCRQRQGDPKRGRQISQKKASETFVSNGFIVTNVLLGTSSTMITINADTSKNWDMSKYTFFAEG